MNYLKKITAIIIGVALSVLTFGMLNVATANEGPHGAYNLTTEKCAGCHRPHTANRTKLLKTSTYDLTGNGVNTDIADFCFSCHRDGSGANNNVYGGYFMGYKGPGDAGVTGDVTSNPWPGEPTNTSHLGTKNAGLNGGGFSTTIDYWASTDADGSSAVGANQTRRLPFNGRTSRGVNFDDTQTSTLANGTNVNHFDHGTASLEAATSYHNALDDTKTWTVWGSLASGSSSTVSVGPGMLITLKCTSCHDQHGSRHYRILRDSRSNPALLTSAGWVNQLDEYGAAKATQYPSTTTQIQSWEKEFNSSSFTKDYTSYSYKMNSGVSLSDFCKTCHSQYYSSNEVPTSSDPSKASYASYDAGDGLGNVRRYRHFTEATIDRAPGGCSAGTNCAGANLNKWVQLPLASGSNVSAAGERNGVDIYLASIDAANDYIVCTTCHFAHGTTATMVDGSKVGPTSLATATGSAPGNSNLLRLDNRGVCEDCHGWTPTIQETGDVCSNEYGDEITDCAAPIGQ